MQREPQKLHKYLQAKKERASFSNKNHSYVLIFIEMLPLTLYFQECCTYILHFTNHVKKTSPRHPQKSC